MHRAVEGGVHAVVIASGTHTDMIAKIVRGEKVGTVFLRSTASYFLFYFDCNSDGSDSSTPKAETNPAVSKDKTADDFSSIARLMAENARQGSRDLQCLTSSEREKILFKCTYIVSALRTLMC